MPSNYKLIRSAALGAILSIVAVTVITIAGELYAPLKDWLKSVFTHHWLGKSIISVAVFVVFWIIGMATFRADEDKTRQSISVLFSVAVLCTFALAGFFIYHSWA